MKKVAVTGLGVICPLGDNVATVWEAMAAGKVGTGQLQLIDPTPYRVKIGKATWMSSSVAASTLFQEL